MKSKNKAASELAKKRWKGTTPAERKEAVKKANAARWPKKANTPFPLSTGRPMRPLA